MRAARAAAAQNYFRRHAVEWDRIRRLHVADAAVEAAIRADGKAVEANLRGFRAGFGAAGGGSRRREEPRKRQSAPAPSLADLESGISAWPEAARVLAAEGVRRVLEEPAVPVRLAAGTVLRERHRVDVHPAVT